MEEVPSDPGDPLPSAATDGIIEIAETSRPRLPLTETRRLGGIATRQVEKVREIMSDRRGEKEELVSQAMAAELGRSARRGAMKSARTA